jgi:hypothetical protein
MLTHIWFTVIVLPWKRHWLLHSRPLGCWMSNNNEMCLTLPVRQISLLSHWFQENLYFMFGQAQLFFWKFCLRIWFLYITEIQSESLDQFSRKLPFCVLYPVANAPILGPEMFQFTSTSLGWMNSWLLNMNEVPPPVQVLVQHISTHTCRQTDSVPNATYL